MYNLQAVIVSKRSFWDGLSPAEQKVDQRRHGRSHHVPARRLARAQSDVALDQLSPGMQVTEFPPPSWTSCAPR